MEYFLGSIITLLTIFVVGKLLSPSKNKEETIRPRYSQSHIHSLIFPLIPEELLKRKPKKYQSTVHDERTNIRVIIMGDKAYWVKDNIFYTAEINDDSIDKDTTKVVDTMSMDKVQLDKMLFIIDQLRDGKTDDSGSAGE